MISANEATPIIDRVAPPTATPADHPMLPIPYELFIRNRRFQGTDISVIAGSAMGLPDKKLAGHRGLAQLRFNFDGFAVSIEAEVTTRLISTENENLVEFTFVDPAGPHLPQLRHIMNSYIAGDLVTLGTVLQPAADARNKPKQNRPARSISRLIGGLFRGAATLALALGLGWGALTLVESRVFTVTEPHPAVVTLPGQTLRSPSAGQVEYVNASAAEGEVAFSILSNAGIVLSLKMPCTCDVSDVTTFVGATVLAGEPLLRLASDEGAPVVTAQLGGEALAALGAGYNIRLRSADGTVIPAQLGPDAARQIVAPAQGQLTTLTLQPVTPLSSSAAGDLLSLQLTRPGTDLTDMAKGWSDWAISNGTRLFDSLSARLAG